MNLLGHVIGHTPGTTYKMQSLPPLPRLVKFLAGEFMRENLRMQHLESCLSTDYLLGSLFSFQ